jgi:hypothetical protein
MVTTMAFKPDKGLLWDSSQQRSTAPQANGGGLAVGNFKPYVWVGGIKRGIAFMADSDKDWVPDDTKKVSAIEVVRDDQGVNLVLNLVARPFTFDHAREITFSLQATPVRPLPDDFRKARLQLSMSSAFPGCDADGWSWDGAMVMLNGNWYLGGHGSAPYPLNWAKNIAYNKSLEQSSKVVTKYQAMNAFFHHPEINDPRVPGVQGANWYGYVTNEITTNRDIWDASISHTDKEYRIWRYQRWIKEAGLHGFYFDNSYSCQTANPDAGLGYVIDLPDRPTLHGMIQPGYAYTETRDLLKRLRNVIVEEGHRPYLWIHCTDSVVISAYSFADCLLDGENLPMISPENPWFSEKWSPEYMQTLNDASKWGIGIDFLDLRTGFEPMHLSALTRNSYRDMAGYLMLHDSEGGNTQNLNWHGLDLGRKAEFLPYWDAKVSGALHASEPTTLVSAWRQDNNLSVVVFNRSPTTRPSEKLQIDLGALGLSAQETIPFKVVDMDSGVAESEVGAPLRAQAKGLQMTVTFPVTAHNYRRFLIRPAQHLASAVKAPSAIAGLQAWYRSDIGCSSAKWIDQSEKHLDLSQPDATKQPAYVPAAVGRMSALRFSKDRPLSLASSIPFTLGDSTILFVYTVRYLNGSRPMLQVGQAPTPYRALQFGGYLGWVVMTNGVGDTGWFMLNQVDVGAPQLLTVTQIGDTVSAFENSMRMPVKTASLPGAQGKVMGPLTIGGQHDWDLAEVVIYDHVLSDKDRQAVTAYFADRYEIQ